MKNAKICILGDYENRLDEGMINVAYNIYQNLISEYPNLKLINIKNAYSLKFWKNIISIKPDIIHYIPGPTIKGLILVKVIQLLTKSKSVVSATRPSLTKYFKILSSILKPNVIIIQSKKSEKFFKKVGYKTIFIPNGVDVERFVPVNPDTKSELRKKYGFDQNDFIILHVGPITKARNQTALIAIPDTKKLLVVSLTNKSEKEACLGLDKDNVTIWTKYFPNIEEVYNLVDTYVFPGFDESNSIEIPLAILEAMSSNLPVISTRHGALERIIHDVNGFFFIEKPEQINDAISQIRTGNLKIETRQSIQQFSWKNIAKDIAKVYENVYQSGAN